MASFTDDEWADVIGRLTQATYTGKIHWHGRDKGNENEPFRVRLGSGTTYRLQSRDQDGEFPYLLSIEEPDGRVVATYETGDYVAVKDWNDEMSTSESVDHLYRSVARLVTGSPQKAKSLIGELDDVIRGGDETPF